jgi:putative alpha-1,2-mannosidase
MAADHDGEYMSFAGGKEVVQGRAEGGYWYYDDFSMWDTYRATVPLQFLVVPEVAPDLVQSLGKHLSFFILYDYQSLAWYTPRVIDFTWCM